MKCLYIVLGFLVGMFGCGHEQYTYEAVVEIPEIPKAPHESNSGLSYAEAQELCDHLEGFGLTSDYFQISCLTLFAELVETNHECKRWIEELETAEEKKVMIKLWPHPCSTGCVYNKCVDDKTLRQCVDQKSSLVVNCEAICEFKGYNQSFGCFQGEDQQEFINLMYTEIPMIFRFGNLNAGCLCR
jgi:hypothetical protein